MVLENVHWLFLLLLPLVAFLYASVGHGGASGYLALMALFSFSPEIMRPTGLLLNLFVAGISFYHFWRVGYLNFKLFLGFALGSIPLSFLGGMYDIDTSVYKIILGVLLIFAILKMLNILGKPNDSNKPIIFPLAIIIGAFIGFFSGLIGIGGGIILSPVILLLKWGNVKEAATVSALFIWVNSASGILGQYAAGFKLDENAMLYVIIALIGGFAGGYYGSSKINNQNLRHLLALVLILASFKLILF
ncbi:MAG: sulfite exporter TauE/SafE family protein [Crocinitomicaceae bacterium]|nr:sulfite exporter TauE/SafE family protein [Crocinitomicaceae bacterium]